MNAAVAAGTAFALMLGLATIHAGHASWIQGLNYLVAGLPLALSMLALGKARREKDARARRLFVYYFVMAVIIVVYGWSDVEKHKVELKTREAAIERALAASDEATLQKLGVTVTERELVFSHSLSRRHIFDRASRQWRDDDAAP